MTISFRYESNYMANSEHLAWLREGTASWNARRLLSADLSGENLATRLGTDGNDATRGRSIDLSNIWLPRADLSNITLKDTDLSRGDFSDANFTDADLSGSDFSESKCNGAKFHGADLTLTKFSGYNLFETEFSFARLNSAKLQDAAFLSCRFHQTQFQDAALKGAIFGGCDLSEARLNNTALVGVEFPDSRPWTAQLFDPPNEGSLCNFQFNINEIDHIDGLLQACRELKAAYGEDATLYFRGESSHFKELCPAVMRMRNSERSFRSMEAKFLNDLMTHQPESYNGVNSALAQWVFSQHHGLPTRLLDVTRNPLVALFNCCSADNGKDGRLHIFAVPNSLIKPFNSDAVRIICNFAKLPRNEQNLLLGKSEKDTAGDVPRLLPSSVRTRQTLFSRAMERLYFLIRQESPFFQEKIDLRDLFRVFVVEPQRMFERIRVQSGAFLVSAFHERFERDEILKWNKDTPIYAHHTVSVPRTQQLSILEELSLLNVTHAVLFPSVDEAARAIVGRHDNGRDS